MWMTRCGASRYSGGWLVIESIASGLRTDHKVTIAGFGTFQRRERAARTGVNPSTGQKMTIEASTTCGFKPATALKQTL